jgi:hypothetical protein
VSDYIFNPKMVGSNVVACVPQQGRCPVRCSDCFYQPGKEGGESRAYLGPHYEHTPNIPPIGVTINRIVRVNDVNDSNNQRDVVLTVTQQFVDKFFNTSIPNDLEGFVYPVVLTVNPGNAPRTDTHFNQLYPVPKNLMFVRARVNSWNLPLIDQIVTHYTGFEVFVVLTFMAYYETPIPDTHRVFYSYRQRTKNSYQVIRPEVWDMIVVRYKDNPFVKTCGVDAMKFSCADCRNCENLYVRKIKELALPSDVVQN